MTDTLPMFALMALLTVATPGPTVLLTLRHGAHGGYHAALPSVAGAVASDLLLIAAVAVGLGWLLSTSALAFELLRAAGVAYLVWLGLRLLRGRGVQGSNALETPSAPIGARQAFWRSLWVALSNPKGYLFFTALLPQHVHMHEALWPQYLLLAAVFASIDAAVLLAYASAGALGLRHLGARWLRRLDGVGGALLLALAGTLALMRRPAS